MANQTMTIPLDPQTAKAYDSAPHKKSASFKPC